MTRVAVATTSQLGADAAAEVAASGGNAVDCALAAILATSNTEPGVCALSGGAYVTVWQDGGDPITVDGNVAVPGIGMDPARRGAGVVSVDLEYGGGLTTIVGPGTVATPGALAAFELAWQRFGSARWHTLFEPAVRACRDGFPLSASCHYYLGYSGRPIFCRSADGERALFDEHGLRPAGAPIVVPHLADSLELIAREGARAYYEGDLATKICDHVQSGDGLLSREDMSAYRAIERPAIRTSLGQWTVASNPLPAVGGLVLSAMLEAFARESSANWDVDAVNRLVEVQYACLTTRKERLDLADNLDVAAAALLDAARSGRLSPSTVHTSAVDDAGTACSITASSGYGSGEMPDDTGLWLNNALGETELNRRGFAAGPPGARLPSNMAPSVARKPGTVLAIGSPGADRITTAIHQVLVNRLQMDMALDDAIAMPRVHVDTSTSPTRLMMEAGLPAPDTDLPVHVFDEISMYFGGVSAATYDKDDGFSVAADPRREGGTCVAGA